MGDGGGVPVDALVDVGEAGFLPAEEIAPGSSVLTHRRRRRTVSAVMRGHSTAVVRIDAMGAPNFSVAADHRFLVRHRNPGRIRSWSEQTWVEAGELVKGDTLGMPLDEPGTVPVVSPALAYVIGRWLGDGWIVDHRRTSKIPQGQRGSRVNSRVHKTIICAAHGEEADELAEAISSANLHATRAPDRTAVKFHISSMEMLELLRPFGRGADGKHLPGWAFTATQEERAQMLQGWLDADGSQQATGAWRGTTVSERLAFGMARLGRDVYGLGTSVHRFHMGMKTSIEGRLVNQRDQFQVVIPPRSRESFVADGYAWMPVRSVVEADSCDVFNISVDEDKSFTTWGYAVKAE